MFDPAWCEQKGISCPTRLHVLIRLQRRLEPVPVSPDQRIIPVPRMRRDDQPFPWRPINRSAVLVSAVPARLRAAHHLWSDGTGATSQDGHEGKSRCRYRQSQNQIPANSWNSSLHSESSFRISSRSPFAIASLVLSVAAASISASLAASILAVFFRSNFLL